MEWHFVKNTRVLLKIATTNRVFPLRLYLLIQLPMWPDIITTAWFITHNGELETLCTAVSYCHGPQHIFSFNWTRILFFDSVYVFGMVQAFFDPNNSTPFPLWLGFIFSLLASDNKCFHVHKCCSWLRPTLLFFLHFASLLLVAHSCLASFLSTPHICLACTGSFPGSRQAFASVI